MCGHLKMAMPFDLQQDNTAARLSSSDLKSPIALAMTTLSTVTKAHLPTHIKYQGENLNENPKKDDLSDGETLVNEREGLRGISRPSSFFSIN